MSQDNTGVIIAPIGVQELYGKLGLAPVNGWYDVGYLCGNQHGKIKKWAMHKPIRYDKPGELTDAERTQEREVSDLGDRVKTVQVNGLLFAKATSLGYGNGTTSFIVSKGFLYKLVEGQLPAPDYLAPRPGTDWCRLTDFEGYDHAAPSLFPQFPATQRVRYNYSADGTIVPFDQSKAYDGYRDYFAQKAGFLCAVAWYYNESSHMNVMSLGTYINQNGLEGIRFKDVPAKNKELNLRLFLSSMELYQGNFGSDAWGAEGIFYSADDVVSKVNFYSSGYMHDIELWQCMYDSNTSTKKIRFAFRVYNNAPGSVMMVQPRIYFYNSSAAGDIGMGWQKLMDVTARSVSQGFANWVFTINTPAFKGGEKLRFISYFASGNTVDLTATVEPYDPEKWTSVIEGFDTWYSD